MTHSEIKSLLWIHRCADSACVEVAQAREAILMRDSKEIDGPMLTFTRAQWASFLVAVAAGEFDRD